MTSLRPDEEKKSGERFSQVPRRSYCGPLQVPLPPLHVSLRAMVARWERTEVSPVAVAHAAAVWVVKIAKREKS
jgi:hypothetical protein